MTEVNSLIFESSDLGANLTSMHLRGLLDLGRLRLSSNDLSHMPVDLFSDLKNLSWLDLRSNNMELPMNIFFTLENLRFLELGHNNLQHLPVGIFRTQRKLLHLNLWSNQLHNLSKHVFEGLSSLTDLDLSSNGIEHIESNVFELLANLTNINLSANHFRQLPMGLFANNIYLSQLKLKNNRVTLPTLPDGLLASMPHLKDVQIEACDLTAIPGNLFANSSHLITLTLADNKLAELPSALLADQFDLRNLDLSHNHLKSLSDELFRNTKELIFLKLSENQLTEISSDLFAPLTKLESLFMDNNQLTTISPDAFMYTQNIRSISMDNNQLNFDQLSNTDHQLYVSPFQYLLKLRSLSLRNNTIMFLYRDWKFQLKELQELDLSYNNITSLNRTDLAFQSTNNIALNLMRNQINSLNFQHSTGMADKSMSILLNDNPINCDCKLLGFVQFLDGVRSAKIRSYMKLDIKQLICDKPNSLRGIYVHDLSPRALVCPYGIDDSKQQRCPFGCKCWERSYDSVLLVNCTYGKLTQVPALPLLEGALKSTAVYLTNNNLAQLPLASTPGFANITQLHVAHNQLSQLEAINLPPELTYLDLSYNNFKVLNSSVINFLNNSAVLKSIALSGNPWTCSCQNEPLLSFALNHYKVIQDFKQLQCVDPAEPLKPKKFQDISVTDICPMDKHLKLFLLVVISLFCCLIGITLALCYIYNHEIKVWLYANNRCLQFVTDGELGKDKKYDAFITYSHKDEEFVLDNLLHELEKGPTPFRLCVHERDFKDDAFICDQIVRAVDESQRTIIVLSQNFMESIWAYYEFREAYKSALNEGRARIILIAYDDIESLDADLEGYLKMHTFLKWGDPWFWRKLLYAMPHQYSKIAESVKSNLADDKLELIKPESISPTLTTPPNFNDSQQDKATIVPYGGSNDSHNITAKA